MLFATVEAVGLLGFDVLAVLVTQFMVFAAHVLLGLIIFGIGLFLANLAGQDGRSERRRAGPAAGVGGADLDSRPGGRHVAA